MKFFVKLDIFRHHPKKEKKKKKSISQAKLKLFINRVIYLQP